MKLTITDVQALALAAPWEKVFGSLDKVPQQLLRPASSHKVLPRLGQYTTLVRIKTAEGLEGIGEAYGLPAPEVTATIIGKLLKPMLIGRDAMANEALWQMMYDAQKGAGRTRDFYLEAISGVDQALWDLRGKALGVPVHTLLGGPVREAIWCYSSPIPFLPTPEESVAKAREFLAAGFTAMKLKLGRGVETDVAHAAAVKEAIGKATPLMVDLNCAYDVHTAIQVGKELERIGVYWLEEPLPVDDIAGLAEVRRRVDLPAVTGETHFTKYDFRELLKHEAVDIVMPNLARAGGITEVKRIAALCDAYHVQVAPHGVGSGINIAATLQLCAAIPNFLIYEYNQLLNPLRHGLLASKLEFKDSCLQVPTGAGLGIDVNEAAIAEYTVLTM